MEKCKTFKVFITTLLLVSACIIVSNFSPERVEATSSFPTLGPSIYVDPQNTIAFLSRNFTISVKIFNLTDTHIPDPNNPESFIALGNLYSFDLIISWDPTKLDYREHTVTIPYDVYPDGVLNPPVWPVPPKDIVDEIAGTYELSQGSYFPAVGFNNPGVSNMTFNMTFTAIDVGFTDLTIYWVMLAEYATGKIIGKTLADTPAPGNPDYTYLHVYDGSILITYLGDITDNTPGVPPDAPDGDVDGFDLGEFADAYGSFDWQAHYNILADLTGDPGDPDVPDGDVDGFDLGLFADNYGKIVPP